MRWLRPLLIRRYNSVVSNLLHRCDSCGIPLQLVNLARLGFIPKVLPKPFEKYEDKVYDKHMSKLSEDDRKQLLNAPENTAAPLTKIISPENPRLNAPNSKECLRCRYLKYQNTLISEQTTYNPDIVDKIDDIKDGKMIYVVNGVEFPSGVDRSLIAKYKPIIVITKCDLMFHNEAAMAKFPVFQQYFRDNFDIPSQNVFLISNVKNWGVRNLHTFLSENLELSLGMGKFFIVGDINSGKSSLISRLIFLSKGDVRVNYDKWKLKHGPGISNYPGFTRDSLDFKLPNYQLIDLPGLNSYQLPNFQKFKNVFKQTPIYKRGSHNARYQTLTNHQVLTVGGLFYLKLPQHSNLIVQYKNMINFEPTVLKNQQRIDEVAKTFAENKSLHNKFVVLPQPTSNLQHYVVPPFWGTVDLVIKNFGYVELKVTGAKTTNELLEVLVPKDPSIDVMIRKPLANYVFKALSGRDKRGNPLTKQNKWKSTKIINNYNSKEPFCSKLYPKMTDQYETITRLSNLEYGEDTEITAENCYKYWRS